MGACLSFSTMDNGVGNSHGRGRGGDKPVVHVISLNGDLRQYPLPVIVSHVLQSEVESLSSSSSCFLCNSDRLTFDDFVPALASDEELEPGQIYFVLPKTKLQHKMSASDMAALAVKASVAMQKSGGSSSSSSSSSSSWSASSCCGGFRKNKKARISPVILDIQHEQQQEEQNGELLDFKSKSGPNKAYGLGVSRSGSVRRLQRYSSRRAKMAVRSFRLRLSTIYEGSILQFY